MKAFLEGFEEIVPRSWLQYFDEREIEVSNIIVNAGYYYYYYRI